MSLKSILFSAAKSIIAPFNSNAAAPERIEHDSGATFWWRGNEIVRVVWADGTKESYRDGKLHREDGPAVERPSGTKEWYRDGQLNREDGPAIERADGTREWYRFGRKLSEAQFNELRDRSLAALPARPAPGSRENGPTLEYADGKRVWYRDGKLDREDGPAIEYADGTRVWYHDGKLDREDGPAIEYVDGTREWYRFGRQLSETEFNELRCPSRPEPTALPGRSDLFSGQNSGPAPD